MNLAEAYDGVINWPGPTTLHLAMVVAGALWLVAVVLLSLGRLRRFARGLGLVGLALVMMILWLIHQQTIVEKQGPHITLILYQHPEARDLALPVLIVLPVVAAFVMSSVLFSTRRGLRAQVPDQLKTGRRHLALKEYDAALREYNEAIKRAPDLAEAYYGRGSVHQAMGETARALEDFDRAIERDPRLAAAYLQRAKLRTEAGDLENALADFGELMNLRVNDAETYLNRGICLVKKGLVNAAAADLELVLKLTNHPDFADPAKNYLRYCQDTSSVPPSVGNGSPLLPSRPQPEARD
jgi:tetratricopeptide (TPR) repeat protein